MCDAKQKGSWLVAIIVGGNEIQDAARRVSHEGELVLDPRRKSQAMVRALAREMAYAKGQEKLDAYRAAQAW